MKPSRAFFALFFSVAFVIFAAVFATPSFASDEEREKHPIEVELEKKIDADPSTAGMIEACRWAEGEWDKLLNKNYQALMKRLGKDEQAKLKAAQLEWIKFRDADFAFNGKFWSGFDGSMFRLNSPSDRADFVRDRALRLGRYLSDLDDK
jgi:uncharacterized protein YecT (DUF1311 family)